MIRPVGFDLETAKAGSLFLYGPGFIKLCGFTDAGGKPGFLTDPADLISLLNEAPWIYGHNIMGFDLLALAFYHGADWERLAAKALDTMILDRLDYPPQARDTGGSVDRYDLDHVCERRGLPGKVGDLRELANEFGGYAYIPADDFRYRAYLAGDIQAIRNLASKLPRTPYARREHKMQSIMGRMTLNGFRVNLDLLHQRIAEGKTAKRGALEMLRDDYDLPLGRFEWSGRGKDKIETWEEFGNPLTTLEGRRWLIEVYRVFDVRNPPVTDKGRLAISADALAPLADSPTVHPDLARIIDLMQTVTTTRTVYQTVADHLAGDRVHPLINMGQASGRSSVTSPGLTVFGKHGGRWRERSVFIPEEGHALLACDMSQVDMRGIAGLCQDPSYMALFEDGRDAHTEMAIQIFGDPARRQDVKPIGHGWNYGLGINHMIDDGFDPVMVRTFFKKMQDQYPVLCEWREGIREQGRTGKMLDNGWGRRMRCDPSRAFTQAPALMGQGAAADIVKEAILRLPREFNPMLRMFVHDEIVMSVPIPDFEEIRQEVIKAMTFEWRGVPIECEASKPGSDWGIVSGSH